MSGEGEADQEQMVLTLHTLMLGEHEQALCLGWRVTNTINTTKHWDAKRSRVLVV